MTTAEQARAIFEALTQRYTPLSRRDPFCGACQDEGCDRCPSCSCGRTVDEHMPGEQEGMVATERGDWRLFHCLALSADERRDLLARELDARLHPDDYPIWPSASPNDRETAYRLADFVLSVFSPESKA